MGVPVARKHRGDAQKDWARLFLLLVVVDDLEVRVDDDKKKK